MSFFARWAQEKSGSLTVPQRASVKCRSKEAVLKNPFHCFMANKPSYFLLPYADTQRALNIPRGKDAGGEVLPVWLSRNVAGTPGPQHLYGNRLHSPLCAGGAAQSERGHTGKCRLLKSQVPQQGNRKQEHAAETIPACTEKRWLCHA